MAIFFSRPRRFFFLHNRCYYFAGSTSQRGNPVSTVGVSKKRNKKTEEYCRANCWSVGWRTLITSTITSHWDGSPYRHGTNAINGILRKLKKQLLSDISLSSLKGQLNENEERLKSPLELSRDAQMKTKTKNYERRPRCIRCQYSSCDSFTVRVKCMEDSAICHLWRHESLTRNLSMMYSPI